jgi:hypothetical protein
MLHAATVSGGARFITKAVQAGRSVTTGWSGLAIPSTPVPSTGRLMLSASGAAPPVTFRAPGEVTIAGAGLSLVLTGHKPGDTATNLTTIRVQCTLNPGQNATLATVPVTGVASNPGRPAKSRATGSSSRASTRFCPPLPKGGLKLNPRFPPPPLPPGKNIIINNPSHGCTYVTGYANVRKLKGASLVGPGLTNLVISTREVFNYKINYFQEDSVGILSYHGRREFPPARATFLGFGFVPTSATMQIIEVGTINNWAVGPALQTPQPKCHGICPTISTVSSRVRIRIYDVTVNGAPLNVGSRCQTPPFDIVLTGSSASTPPYNITEGGPLTGTVTIPSFTGCGVGENLDPLFTAAISGSGNFSLLTQGKVCQPGPPPIFCPPVKPKPLR